MADTKNSGLSELAAVAADDDLLYLVDVSDTSMAVTGTSKKNKAKYYLRTNGTANTLGANLDANNYNFTGGGTVAASAMRAANYYGGTASGGTATISSTTHATKGKVLFGSVIAFDEVNNRLGVGTAAPSAAVYVKTGSSDGVFLDASAYPVMRFLVAGSAAYEMFYDQTISTFKLGIPNTAVHLLIDSAGKVGIGAAPSYKLDALASSGAQSIARFGQSGVSNGFTVASDGAKLTYTFDPSVTISGGTVTCVDVVETSSQDEKENFEFVTGVVEKLGSIKAYRYNDKRDPEGQKQRKLGLLAEEFERDFPDVVAPVIVESAEGEQRTTKGLKYSRLVALAIQGINELADEQKKITQRLAALENKRN